MKEKKKEQKLIGGELVEEKEGKKMKVIYKEKGEEIESIY